ncbi:hypothetical protein OHV05_05920 [Kitasatospora sp. NBC_00070]|uniref:hypothetical protein n=1 Tax=Kitasatospora sp. NBC_00070 TaxID=2975962 RepID=UPI00324D425E
MNRSVPPQLSTAELTSEAAELIRAAGLAAQPGGPPGLLHLADAAHVVGALAGLTARLPELLDQVAAFLSSEQATGRIGPQPTRNDHAGAEFDAIRLARDAREHLYEAGRTAALLAESVAAASTALSPMGATRTAGGPTTPHI